MTKVLVLIVIVVIMLGGIAAANRLDSWRDDWSRAKHIWDEESKDE